MNQRFLFLIIMLVMFSVMMSCSRMDRGITNEEFLLLTETIPLQVKEIEEIVPIIMDKSL